MKYLFLISLVMLTACGNRQAYYQPPVANNNAQHLANWQLQQMQMQQQQMQAQQVINNNNIQHQNAYQNLLRTLK